MSDPRRGLPSVSRLLEAPAVAAALAGAPRATGVAAVRRAVAAARAAPDAAPRDAAGWARAVAGELRAATRPTLRRCINATGVVLHTNLGRAPLAAAAREAVAAVAAGYSTLEYDADEGARGDRHVHCAGLLGELTGAGGAMVVNNAAAALLLALSTAARGGDVVVSRGELIEIGGGFRIPEILETSGARLVEVGTTNRTRLADYEKALQARRTDAPAHRRTGKNRRPAAPVAILKVHRSNFRQEGFVADAGLAELIALGRKRRVPVIYDLGGGLMLDLDAAGLAGEPTLPAAARSGATAVVASGDKLLGGPQAGILVGAAAFVARCRTNPLARAVRADKLTLGALAATLALYRDGDAARREVPVLRMLTAQGPALEARAAALASRLPPSARAAVRATRAAVGGGAFPGVELASAGIELSPSGLAAGELARRLRRADPPVVAVVAAGKVVLDVRTILAEDEPAVVAAVAAALA
ncbi:MAG TPA: L-seryl-tRNA(Sec) selenium transferase [Gemmatimonadales bacterium]|nr:L-seryl-tRNA(Sec) selenium transferase [Gemmatimonadales bacterium]